MTQWFRSYWPDDDVWLYFELDDEGYVMRQVELEGPEREPIKAASLQEWEDAYRTDTTGAYEATYGVPSAGSSRGWRDHDLHDLTAEEFETIWATARAACEAGSRSRQDPSW